MDTATPRRSDPSAVIRTPASESWSRVATASAAYPLKMGTEIAPSFAQASVAATVSGAMGMKIPTVWPSSTPSSRSPPASRSAISRSSPYETMRTEPSSPSHRTAVFPGVRWAHRSTQLWARLIDPPVNHRAQGMPSEVSRMRSYGS